MPRENVMSGITISGSDSGVLIAPSASSVLIFEGSTFSCGFGTGATVKNAVIAFPDFDEGKAHLMAFGYHWVSEQTIGLVLFSAEDGKTVAYTLGSGGKGSAREFTACNQFVNHGPYLSVADVEKNILYVTTFPEQMAAGWAYKLVPFDAILKYIVKRMALAELDAAAECEQQARDELARLLRENQELMATADALYAEKEMVLGETHRLRSEMIKAERKAYDQKRRADSLVETLDRFANWVERMQWWQGAKVFGCPKAPNTTAAVMQVLRDRKIKGFSAFPITLAGLINGQADPVD